MTITDNFSLGEFSCKDADNTPYPSEWIVSRLLPLCIELEVIRASSGGPLHIVSGYRTKEHNIKVGGAEHSQHIEGRAVDIVSKKLSPAKLGALIEALIHDKKIKDGGLGVYAGWCHYDLRPEGHARWTG